MYQWYVVSRHLLRINRSPIRLFTIGSCSTALKKSFSLAVGESVADLLPQWIALPVH